MDGRFILFAKTLCLSLRNKKKFPRIYHILNNGKKTDEVHNESINDFNMGVRRITGFELRESQSVLVKSKVCFGLSNVSFSYVLCKNTKKFRKQIKYERRKIF